MVGKKGKKKEMKETSTRSKEKKGCKVIRLQGCKVARLQGLQGCKVAEFYVVWVFDVKEGK